MHWRDDRIGSALRGENPTVIRRLPGGFAVMGDVQWLSGYCRINIEILGNTDPFLHAHIWPRYTWEVGELWRAPVWLHPRERWHDPATALGPQHDTLRAAIGAQLDTSGG